MARWRNDHLGPWHVSKTVIAGPTPPWAAAWLGVLSRGRASVGPNALAGLVCFGAHARAKKMVVSKEDKYGSQVGWGRIIGCVAEISNRVGKAHQVEAPDVRVGLHSSRYKMGRGCMVVCLDGLDG